MAAVLGRAARLLPCEYRFSCLVTSSLSDCARARLNRSAAAASSSRRFCSSIDASERRVQLLKNRLLNARKLAGYLAL